MSVIDLKECFVKIPRLPVDDALNSSDEELSPLPHEDKISSYHFKKVQKNKSVNEIFEDQQELVKQIKEEKLREEIRREKLSKAKEIDKQPPSFVESDCSESCSDVEDSQEIIRIFCKKACLQFFNFNNISVTKCGYSNDENQTPFEKHLLLFQQSELKCVLSSALRACHFYHITSLKAFVTYSLHLICTHTNKSCINSCANVLKHVLNEHPHISNIEFTSPEIFILLFNYGIDIDDCMLLHLIPEFRGHLPRNLEHLYRNEIPKNWIYNIKALMESLVHVLGFCKFSPNDLFNTLLFFLWMGSDNALLFNDLYYLLQKCVKSILERFLERDWSSIGLKLAKTLLSLDFTLPQRKLKCIYTMIKIIPRTTERGIHLRKVTSSLVLREFCVGPDSFETKNETFTVFELQYVMEHISKMEECDRVIAVKFLDICLSQLKEVPEDELCKVLKFHESLITTQENSKLLLLKIHTRLTLICEMNKMISSIKLGSEINEESCEALEELKDNSEINSKDSVPGILSLKDLTSETLINSSSLSNCSDDIIDHQMPVLSPIKDVTSSANSGMVNRKNVNSAFSEGSHQENNSRSFPEPPVIGPSLNEVKTSDICVEVCRNESEPLNTIARKEILTDQNQSLSENQTSNIVVAPKFNSEPLDKSIEKEILSRFSTSSSEGKTSSFCVGAPKCESGPLDQNIGRELLPGSSKSSPEEISSNLYTSFSTCKSQFADHHIKGESLTELNEGAFEYGSDNILNDFTPENTPVVGLKPVTYQLHEKLNESSNSFHQVSCTCGTKCVCYATEKSSDVTCGRDENLELTSLVDKQSFVGDKNDITKTKIFKDGYSLSAFPNKVRNNSLSLINANNFKNISYNKIATKYDDDDDDINIVFCKKKFQPNLKLGKIQNNESDKINWCGVMTNQEKLNHKLENPSILDVQECTQKKAASNLVSNDYKISKTSLNTNRQSPKSNLGTNTSVDPLLDHVYSKPLVSRLLTNTNVYSASVSSEGLKSTNMNKKMQNCSSILNKTISNSENLDGSEMHNSLHLISSGSSLNSSIPLPRKRHTLVAYDTKDLKKKRLSSKNISLPVQPACKSLKNAINYTASSQSYNNTAQLISEDPDIEILGIIDKSDIKVVYVKNEEIIID